MYLKLNIIGAALAVFLGGAALADASGEEAGAILSDAAPSDAALSDDGHSGAVLSDDGHSDAVLSDDGLWIEPFSLESFLILPEDQQDALAQGKRLMMVWEQRGCPYCTMLHQINFADPAIRKELTENFAVLQLNKYGSRNVTDFDGEEMEERKLAAKYRVLFTPTVQFFALDMDGIDVGKPRAAEVTRMPGYLPPAQFLSFLQYVKDEKFRVMSFREYLGPDTELEIDGTPVE